MSKTLSFRHAGEYGDILFMQPVLRALGGKHIIRLVDRVKEPPFSRPLVKVSGTLIPLLESQPYVEKVECSEAPCDVDMSKFRSHHRPIATLTNAQVDYFNSLNIQKIQEDGSVPWLLGIEPSPETKGKVIVARSSRYQNNKFPWREIVEHYGDRVLFVGLPVEHIVFSNRFGAVPHRQIKDFHELAQLIAGASLFIGNQSAPMAVAIGLGGPIIQETFFEQPDCIFPRSNIQYVPESDCVLPDVSGSGELRLEHKKVFKMPDFGVDCITPPANWQYPGLPPHTHFMELMKQVAQLEQCSRDEAHEKLLVLNVKRCPDYFMRFDTSSTPVLKYNMARMNAGLS